jgi:hypothetical protein
VPELITNDIFALAGDEPLVLAGSPTALTGHVELRNQGNANLVIRDAGLKDPSGVLTGELFRHPLPPLVLRPNQTRTIPFKVAIDPTTPPGEYHVELDLAGRSRSAVLYVTEMFDLTVRPRSVVVLNLPGHVQQRRLIVTNEGNVALNIGDIGEIDLYDDLIFDRVIRVAANLPVDRAKADIEELVVAVLRVVREHAPRVGVLQVRNLGGKVDVAPGQTAVIDLGITLQEELPHNSRFRGHAPLLTQDLEIIVVPSSEPATTEPHPTQPHPTPEHRATEPAGKAATESKKSTRRRGGGS